MPNYEYARPGLTVDVLVLGRAVDGALSVLLIRRGKEPFEGQLALPGGFVEVADERGAQGEHPRDAALRELQEETGLALTAIDLRQVGAYGKPDRDPRGRMISILYRCEVGPPLPEVRGGDDAAEAQWMPLGDILAGAHPLAFDHLELVQTAVFGEEPP